jgi:DNA-binding transcriptional MerR regulator
VDDRHTPATIDPAQQELFAIPDPEPTAGVGYRGPVAAAAARITYRQLGYWARTGLVEPSIRVAAGSGSYRLYSFRDILVLQVVKRLLGTGVGLPSIRAAVATLRDRGVADLASLTLMSDGVGVYECTSDDDVVDLVRGGQGVFGIAIGAVWSDVRGYLADVPAEPASLVDRAADAAAARDTGRPGRWLRPVG